ncbi:T9SS type A sorting domain-containing protein [candidate division KSB1 bacterium]|nr:T9SS type A sorting domain-containing protein [candidate division KSB1 bacterium]
MLPEPGFVSVEIYDLTGKKVRMLYHVFKKEGKYRLSWDGKNDDRQSVSSGIYFYKLNVLTKNGLFTQMRKLLLVR